jgi:hypothetical protein
VQLVAYCGMSRQVKNSWFVKLEGRASSNGLFMHWSRPGTSARNAQACQVYRRELDAEEIWACQEENVCIVLD